MPLPRVLSSCLPASNEISPLNRHPCRALLLLLRTEKNKIPLRKPRASCPPPRLIRGNCAIPRGTRYDIYAHYTQTHVRAHARVNQRMNRIAMWGSRAKRAAVGREEVSEWVLFGFREGHDNDDDVDVALCSGRMRSFGDVGFWGYNSEKREGWKLIVWRNRSWRSFFYIRKIINMRSEKIFASVYLL